MKRERSGHLEYRLQAEGPLIGKIVPKGGSVSRVMYRPLRSVVDVLLQRHFNGVINNEVWQAYRENWLNFAVRVISDPIDRPKRVKAINEDDIAPSRKRELRSGVTRLTTNVEGEKITCFIAPSDFVPFSLRTMDILPDKDESVAVSASLRHIAKKVKNASNFPAIQMTAAGWNFMTLFSDAVYLTPLDGQPPANHVKRHIKDTILSTDTRTDAQYFTLDDLYEVLDNPPQDFDVNRETYLLPGRDAHWLVTNKDATIQVMSTSDILAADSDREAFRSKVASITSTVGYVDGEIAQEPLGEGALERFNVVVLFNHNGEQRLGSMHGMFETNAINMFTLANHIVKEQYSGAEQVAVCVMDDGGSSGAIVQKRKNWQRGRKNRFDTSTLPNPLVIHEIPIYTALVPADYVRNRYS